MASFHAYLLLRVRRRRGRGAGQLGQVAAEIAQPDDAVIIDGPQMEDHAAIARSARWAVLLNGHVARAHSTADARKALGGLGYDVRASRFFNAPVSIFANLTSPAFQSPHPGAGMDLWPPGWPMAQAAADWAAWTASASDAPAVRCAAKVAVNASLAPVVSTATVF